MPDLSYRSNQPELIDDFELDNDALRQNLEELALINQYLGGNQVTIGGLKALLKNHDKSKAIVIGDLGCGGGDMLKLMARWLQKKGYKSKLVGIDANDFMIDFAKKRTQDFPNISYLHENVFAESFQQHTFDIVGMTLFCHHFTDEQLIRLFQLLKKQCRVGFVINDIHRHWFAYHSIAWITKLFLKSYLVKHDAKLSVWRAFKKSEIVSLLEKAGIHHYRIRWRWAFRWEVVVKTDQL
ncbi:methyltransferase domain-containing protein [Flectobacillus sp. BAB-3569]|uniref:methyltransferase domain-containing protein n=1 Tax=Flectobacillus sp. BAB-3569 TaxID=1509483 RepID=UPI000BA3438C|nr:methyltransferase domain-containing protein [Flectobacillus sp. BAB-3569]PAC32022.1 SAM-dependent methyltransferase [Flectobacillus sp. BAB-3569]